MTEIPAQDVEYQLRDHVAWVTMNRPDVLNALSKGMFQGLEKAFKKASADPSVHFVVIGGAGRAFSAGLDVREVNRLASPTEAHEFVFKLVRRFWDRLFACEKPVIARVDGPAYGAGAEIALSSDIVVASSRSTFAFSGGRVGALCCISAGLGEQTMLGRKVVEMNLTGAAVSAEEARSVGLVNYVESPENIDDRINQIFETMRHVSPISNASFKRIRDSTFTTRLLDIAHKELFRTITSSDFKKGAEAFTSKQQPEYYR